MDDKFWLNDPKILFSSSNVIPNSDMSNTQKLNTLTRLLLIICIGLYAVGSEQYFTVLVFGLLLILILKYYNKTDENFTPEIGNAEALKKGIRGFIPGYDSKPHGPANKACWFDENTDLLNAAYEIRPPLQFNHDEAAKRSYMNAKYELTPLTDTDGFKDIWRAEPEMQGWYNMIPDVQTEFPVYDELAQGQCNYIVRSKIDHLPISQSQNDLNSTRPVAEAAYMQSSIDFRNGLLNEHIDRFRRERQHNCADMPLNGGTAGSGYSN
jgi:hypothetical protein